jgi:cell division protein FtsQ
MRLRTRTNRRKAESPLKRLPPLKIDPRWHVNWRAVLWPPLIVAGLLATFDGARALLDRPVRRLVVEGTFQRVTPLQIEATVESNIDGGFLSLDLDRVSEQVKRLDWIDRVQIGRAWPDTLVVDVVEHQAAARWGDKGLLNVRGELFTDNAQFPLPELPNLAGPPGSEREVARRYLALRGPLAEAGLKLESLTMDERGAWSIELKGGQEIRLGRRDVDERIYRFFDVVAPALAGELQRAKYVDLRYTNGFAVGWADDVKTSGLASKGAPTDAAAERGQRRG